MRGLTGTTDSNEAYVRAYLASLAYQIAAASLRSPQPTVTGQVDQYAANISYLAQQIYREWMDER